MYTYIYVYIDIDIDTYVHTHTHKHTHTNTHTHARRMTIGSAIQKQTKGFQIAEMVARTECLNLMLPLGRLN
jgi:hypothetical protein